MRVEHRVAPLVYHHLQGCGAIAGSLPASVRNCFIALTARNQLEQELSDANLSKILEYLKSAAHDALIVKGASIRFGHGGLYQHTMADDVDLVIRPSGGASGRVGVDQTWPVIDWLLDRRPQWVRQFDLDNRVHHDVVWNGILPIDFEAVWDRAVRVDHGNSRFLVPGPIDNLILCSVNLFRKRILRLRSLLDIAELLDADRRMDWAELAARSSAFGCRAIVSSAIAATRATVGCAATDDDLEHLRVDRYARDRAIRHPPDVPDAEHRRPSGRGGICATLRVVDARPVGAMDQDRRESTRSIGPAPGKDREARTLSLGRPPGMTPTPGWDADCADFDKYGEKNRSADDADERRLRSAE